MISRKVASTIAKKEVEIIAKEVASRIATEEAEQISKQEALMQQQMEEDDKMYERVIE